MSSIVALSLCGMAAGGVIGFSTDFSGIGLALAALSAIIFVSAMDAWECEERSDDVSDEALGRRSQLAHSSLDAPEPRTGRSRFKPRAARLQE
jgi:hypothetical protein